ncbi:meprin A subunit beta [Marmota monax]|uniref:Metalloendopeptidase n=1 Tax=Marmota monax TaxID=9995 RepID=A0A834QE24_MARMO|nr:meprin A subunit beta [Marmota monax]
MARGLQTQNDSGVLEIDSEAESTDLSAPGPLSSILLLSSMESVNAKAVILQAFDRYRLKTCLDFKPWSGEDNYIAFFKGTGCWSSIGNRREGKQQLSIGNNCDRIGTVQHELLHALGFWHEQSRSDRDDYIQIMWNRIKPGREHNFNIHNDKESDFLNVPYDYFSVMHYSKIAFKSGQDPTIITKMADFEDLIGQRMDFSDYDLQKLNRLYNCSSSLSFMDSCNFELENICGMIQSSEDKTDWKRVSNVSGGPKTDYSNMGKCKGSGFFMHFNSSSVSEGDTAVMETRMLYPKREFQCLEFYLHNSGSTNDYLNIYVRNYAVDDVSGHRILVKQIKEIPIGIWKLYYIPLKMVNKFRVVFEGLRGSGASSGGLSIDDINLSETQCPEHVWHIRNFEETIDKENGILLSPPFYSPKGYAFQIQFSLKPSTDAQIYLHLVSGGNDDYLKWPCPWQQITMTLLDQNSDIRRRMSNQLSVTTDPFLLDRSDLTQTPDQSNPTSDPNDLCSVVVCENGGMCSVQDGKAECWCPSGEDWWYMGERCEKRGSTRDTIVIAVSSTAAVFVLMLIVTLISVYCTRRRYRQRPNSNIANITLENVS